MMLLQKYFEPIVGTIEEVKELMGWDRMGTLYTTTQPSFLAPKPKLSGIFTSLGSAREKES
jgi:hypothetical protein